MTSPTKIVKPGGYYWVARQFASAIFSCPPDMSVTGAGTSFLWTELSTEPLLVVDGKSDSLAGVEFVLIPGLGPDLPPIDTEAEFSTELFLLADGAESYVRDVVFSTVPQLVAAASYIAVKADSYLTAGSFPYIVPSAGQTKLDLIGLGGGAGGQGTPPGVSNGLGGGCGSYADSQLAIGTDVLAGATITISVGAGGGGTGWGSGSYGAAGAATTFTWKDPSGTTHTLTAAGGLGGHGSANVGLGPCNHTYDSQTYAGGTNAAGNGQAGIAPGGGGAGGLVGSATTGGHGAAGAAWTRAF